MSSWCWRKAGAVGWREAVMWVRWCVWKVWGRRGIQLWCGREGVSLGLGWVEVGGIWEICMWRWRFLFLEG